jgi:putative membrane protein
MEPASDGVGTIPPLKHRSARKMVMKTKRASKLVLAVGVAGLVSAVISVPQARAQKGGTGASGQASTQAQTEQLNSKDREFVVEAARIDMDEVQGGKLAQKKGTSQAVRHFGEHMINDHTEANTGLKEIATQKGVALPTQLSQEQNSSLQHLEGLSGAEFDKAYAEAMVKGHTEAVKLFQQAAQSTTDTDLRAWAETALPLLQEHLRMAKQMQTTVQSEK